MSARNPAGNATLGFNGRRAVRMFEHDALAELARLGFGNPRIVRRTAHHENGDRRRRVVGETVVTDYDRTGTNSDGSPRYDRARLTATFSI
ncbi:hypothetical protein NYO98_10370 [Nocardioides sp. STR2]|uniref:Uncharacterized protein n=1 Tax=Nocardioides pini TaxID=2975053 RepID=A0ABT4CCJ7_9ACTN|nr:hypothetical protein [Nocardioides pini]MCY4726682.1 hypothetical protein [Nocardioides pini]